MSCYEPLRGVVKGKKDGKYQLQIMPMKAFAGNWNNRCQEYFELPCGKCIGCRSDQAREWSNRLLMESLYHENAYFITLTYCDEYLPVNPYGVNLHTGEVKEVSTLNKKDLQNFLKRLREKFEEPIRFYAAGEYGDKYGRCHFHLIVFCPELTDLVYTGKSETGNDKFRSSLIESCWKDTKDRRLNKDSYERGSDPNLIGKVDVEIGNYYTFKYVCNYVTKKIGAKSDLEYVLEGREAPFSTQSRKPGLGLQFYYDHPGIMENDMVVIGMPGEVVKFSPPRYFKKKFREYNPECAERIAMKNLKKANDIQDAQLAQTSMYYFDYLETKKQIHEKRVDKRFRE